MSTTSVLDCTPGVVRGLVINDWGQGIALVETIGRQTKVAIVFMDGITFDRKKTFMRQVSYNPTKIAEYEDKAPCQWLTTILGGPPKEKHIIYGLRAVYLNDPGDPTLRKDLGLDSSGDE